MTEQSSCRKQRQHVYSDSVLCLGTVHEHPASTLKWKEQFGWCMKSKELKELNGIDREPVEFEGHTNAGSPPRDSKKDGTKRSQT